jgi:hypothetical protein
MEGKDLGPRGRKGEFWKREMIIVMWAWMGRGAVNRKTTDEWGRGGSRIS